MMKKHVTALFLMVLAGGVYGADLYVAADGHDADTGTKGKPLASLARAVELARGMDKPATIILGGGVYHLAGTLELTEADSGLTIRAAEGEEVVLSHGREIPAASFSKVKEKKLLERLHEQAKGQVFAASLAGTGIESAFPVRPDELKREDYALVSWNGYALQQATWPNRGYDYVSETLEAGPTTRWLMEDEKPESYSIDEPSGGRFKVRGELDLEMLKAEFERTKDIGVHGYLSNDWFFQKENLGAVDPAEGSLKLLRFTRYGIGNKKLPLPRRVRLVNVLCELDEPGEWYYDHVDQLFYIWPVEPLRDEKPISVAAGPAFIEGRGVQHVKIEHIIFENFGNRGLFFEGCDHILIGGCTFRSGVDLGLTLVDGMHNTISGCDFYDLNRAFLLLGKYPVEREYKSQYDYDINYEYNKVTYSENRRSLTAEENVASNNHIHHCRLRGYGMAAVGGVGAAFRNNLVHNLNGGIMYGHNDLRAEYNEFYDVGYEMGDWNVMYCGADLSLQDNLIRYNFAHHLMETPKGHPMSAWRADDNASGMKTFGNIYYKCGRAAVMGNGPNCSIENSVAMETSLLWWTVQKPYHQISKEEFAVQKRDERLECNADIAAGVRSLFDKWNLIGKAEMVFGRRGWTNNAAWAEAYPNLKDIFADDFMNPECNPWAQSFTVVQHNYALRGTYKDFNLHGRNKMNAFEDMKNFMPASMTFEPTAKVDPQAMFVDPENLDFRMKSGFKPMDGFVGIPFEKIGLYRDKYRTSVPDKAAYRKAVKEKYDGMSSNGGAFDFDKLNDRYPRPAYLK